MAPIRARNAATGSCWCATRLVAARASSWGKSPSTSAPAPIAAIVRSHSRRVPLVTVPFTLHLPSRVVVQYAPGALVSVTIRRGGNEARNDLGFVYEARTTEGFPRRRDAVLCTRRPCLRIALHRARRGRSAGHSRLDALRVGRRRVERPHHSDRDHGGERCYPGAAAGC